MNSLPFPSPVADPADTFHPDLTVACVIQREGRFLLIEERVRGVLVLNQPAGHVESGESLVDAAVRETLEESGWEVRLTGLVGVYQWQAPDGIHFLRFAFSALCHHPERPLDTGIERALWMSTEELRAAPDRLRSPLVQHAVDDALARPPMPLDRVRLV
jgi:ADP-ribose pyrophosphatase YjhB (NUDIX family)